MWAEIRSNHPDVPTVVAVTGPARSAKLAQFTSGRWSTGNTAVGELYVSSAALHGEPRELLFALLHEAVHALAAKRGLRDTSSEGGRYHNHYFAQLAVELGFTAPKKPTNRIGFAAVTLPDATVDKYAFALAVLEFSAIPGPATPVVPSTAEEGLFAEDQVGRVLTPTRAGKRLKVGCSCSVPRTMWVTPGMFELGGIMCRACGADFEPIE
ncbi:hypothetical protein [Kitasatospora sp. NPDC002965]|uniref:hypothetical protein n=1 Tax=Kitasatospora sp. NPDC002965 TaxID=3154775 RepID=UPI0033B3A00F